MNRQKNRRHRTEADVRAIIVALGKLGVLAEIETLCKDRGVFLTAALGPGRVPAVVRARDALVVLLRERLGMSAKGLGRLLHCEHTTILDSLRRGKQRSG